jgi:outer membrane lipoprotein-sorting protein
MTKLKISLMTFTAVCAIVLMVPSGLLAQASTSSAATQPTGPDAVGIEGLGQGKTAKDMIQYMIDMNRGNSSHGKMEMEVVTPDWDRTIGMEWWEKGESLMLVRVLSPSRDTGNGTLKIDNNLWNYIYTFDQTVHIPPAMMAQSWMGSDFTNDDIIRESSIVNDYNHSIEGIEEQDGERCYKILMSADPTTPVPWLTVRVWLKTADLLPVREEYYNDNGTLARYMTFSNYQHVQDRTIPLTMRMVPLDKPGHYTEMRYTEIEFDIDIPDSTFTLQNLQNYQG